MLYNRIEKETDYLCNQIKKALYKAYLRSRWWFGPELNWRHMDFQSIALPTELPNQDNGGPDGN